MSEKRRRLVLDLDTGVDDALALAYALGSPEVELVAVTCTYGNVTVDTAVRNTRALLVLLGHPEIPVYRGADRPLTATVPFAPGAPVLRIHGENGIGNVDLPDPVPADVPSAAELSAALDSETLLVHTGPLTNLAQALRSSADLAMSLSRVTFMGGALALPGNVSACAEANIANDPEAADYVLRSGLPTRMIGLDVTHQAILTRDGATAWRALGTPAARAFADMTDYYIGTYEVNNPQMGGCALHDPLAVAAAIDPTLVGCLDTSLRVDLEGPTRGRTVCDPERLRDPRKSCQVALTVDAPRFLRTFHERMRRALLASPTER